MIETSCVPVATDRGQSHSAARAQAQFATEHSRALSLAAPLRLGTSRAPNAKADAPEPVWIKRDTRGATMFNPHMAADFVTPLIKAGVDLLRQALAYARRLLGKRKYEQLLSTTIAELLKEHPDIDQAKARLAAIETTGVAPSPDLFRARSMLKAVESQSKREKKPRKTGKAKKKSAAAKNRRAT